MSPLSRLVPALLAHYPRLSRPDKSDGFEKTHHRGKHVAALPRYDAIASWPRGTTVEYSVIVLTAEVTITIILLIATPLVMLCLSTECSVLPPTRADDLSRSGHNLSSG